MPLFELNLCWLTPTVAPTPAPLQIAILSSRYIKLPPKSPYLDPKPAAEQSLSATLVANTNGARVHLTFIGVIALLKPGLCGEQINNAWLKNERSVQLTLIFSGIDFEFACCWGVRILPGSVNQKKTGVHAMSAIKQQQSAQPLDFSAGNRNDDLTQQERRALSLIWRDDECEPVKAKRCDPTIEHCAELGYN